jgi:hypothetical protein
MEIKRSGAQGNLSSGCNSLRKPTEIDMIPSARTVFCAVAMPDHSRAESHRHIEPRLGSVGSLGVVDCDSGAITLPANRKIGIERQIVPWE